MLRTLYSSQEIAALRKDDNRVFGLPAASLVLNNNLNNMKGFMGEQIVGNILNLITIEHDNVYVCHSVSVDDTTEHGEIDHVLIYKNRVLLIETKTYSAYSTYRVNKEGVLTASTTGKGRFKRINDSNVLKKRKMIQELFPNRTVQAIVAVARDNVKTWSENGAYKVVSLMNLQSTINTIFQEAKDIKEPSWPVVKHFASLCLPPYQERGKLFAVCPEAFPQEDTRPVEPVYKPKLNKRYTYIPSFVR